MKDKKFVIIGASEGVGKILAEMFLRLGARVALIAENSEALKGYRRELIIKYSSTSLIAQPADLSNPQSLRKAIKQISSKWKNIDGLIHCARYPMSANLENVPPEQFDKSIRANFLDGTYVTKLLLPFLSDGAFISFVTSEAALLGVSGLPTYAEPGFARIKFVEALSGELAEKDIYVNVLCLPNMERQEYNGQYKTKPLEVKKSSKNAKLMKPEELGEIFLKGLQKKKPIILCTLESRILFRLNRLFPTVTNRLTKTLTQNTKNGNLIGSGA